MREIWNLQWLAHFLWTQTDELATVAGGNTRLHFIISLVGGVTSAGERTSAWCTYCTLQVLHGTPPELLRPERRDPRAPLDEPHVTSRGRDIVFCVDEERCYLYSVRVCVSLVSIYRRTWNSIFPPEGIVWWRSTCKLELTFALAFDAILWNVPSWL